MYPFVLTVPRLSLVTPETSSFSLKFYSVGNTEMLKLDQLVTLSISFLSIQVKENVGIKARNDDTYCQKVKN